MARDAVSLINQSRLRASADMILVNYKQASSVCITLASVVSLAWE